MVGLHLHLYKNKTRKLSLATTGHAHIPLQHDAVFVADSREA